MAARVVRSSGNVFRDLGNARDEAEHLKIRSDLMIRLSELLIRRKLTQAKAASLLGVSQPRISDLTRGKIGLFSIDALVDMVTRAGGTVRVDVVGMRRGA